MDIKHEINIDNQTGKVTISLELDNFHPTDKAAFIHRMDKAPDDIGASLIVESGGLLDQFLAAYEAFTLFMESNTENPRDSLEVIRSLRQKYLGIAIAAVVSERRKNEKSQ